MGDEGTQKIAWKRAELAVNRFKKTAEADVIRLTQFKKNIVEAGYIISLLLLLSKSHFIKMIYFILNHIILSYLPLSATNQLNVLVQSFHNSSSHQLFSILVA